MVGNINKVLESRYSKGLNYKDLNESWINSGLSQKAFCDNEKVSYKSFASWRSAEIKAGRINSLQRKSINKRFSSKDKQSFIPIVLPTIESEKPRQAIEAEATKNINIKHQIELHLPHNIILKISV